MEIISDVYDVYAAKPIQRPKGRIAMVTLSISSVTSKARLLQQLTRYFA